MTNDTGIAPAETRGETAAPSRRADIQGLRAVAVLMVVVFHAGLSVPGGFTGVDVFFVISGFVISAMLLRELDGTGRLSFPGFYARRVRRILPASALTISVVALLSVGGISSLAQKTTARTGIGGSVFIANLVLARQRTGYFDVKLTANPLLHIWSLSVEEQFYLIFPALLIGGFLLARRGGHHRDTRVVMGTVIGAVVLLSFALSWYLTGHTFTVQPGGALARVFPGRAIGNGSQLAFYLAPTRAWEFGIGALLAIIVPQLRRVPRFGAIPAGVVGTVLVALGAFGISGTTPFPGLAVLLPVLGTALLIIAGTVAENPFSAALSVKPMTVIGDLSYSWYLWHWPLIVFASALFPTAGRAPALTAAVISLVPAWLSYKLIETPIRSDTRITGRRALGVAAICIAVPIVFCVVLLRIPQPPQSAATKAFLDASRRGHATELRGCNRGVPLAALGPKCTWSAPQHRGRVLLLGDSNAGHFTEPAARAAVGRGYDFTVNSLPECPFVDLLVEKPLSPRLTDSCRRFVTKSLDEVIATKPDLVMLAASEPFYFLDETRFRDPVTGETATTPDAKARLWTDGLARVLTRLSAAGIPTAVIRTVPQWETWDSRSCAQVRVYLAPRSCGTDQTRAEADAFLRRAVAADNRALERVPSANVVDFQDDLCSRTTCATNNGDKWLYKDGRHLSVRGALLLTEHFRSLMQTTMRS